MMKNVVVQAATSWDDDRVDEAADQVDQAATSWGDDMRVRSILLLSRYF